MVTSVSGVKCKIESKLKCIEEEEKEEFANNIGKYWNNVDEFGSPLQYWNNVDDFGNVEAGPPEQPHEPKYFVYL